jgi:hypothetical protein
LALRFFVSFCGSLFRAKAEKIGAVMNLDEAQRKKITGWINDGLKLSEIQNRITAELGLKLTYMDVRLLVDDLKLTPKDPEPPKPIPALVAPAPPPGLPPGAQSGPAKPNAVPGGVSISVDHLARPGAVVSGKVTFGDGNKAEWYIDQSGRLGLVPQLPGYRPPATELQQFQLMLESELSKLGM